MKESKKPRNRTFRILLGLGLVAVAGLTIFLIMLRNWTVVRGMDAAQAEPLLQAIFDSMGDQRPYLEVGEGGVLSVHRELESEDAAPVSSLSMVLWQPAQNRWVRTDFPMWFIRVKTSNGIPLGPIKAALAEDWKELSLEVSDARLSDRGPGLVLHLEGANGRQLVLWNEPKVLE
ncbi:MAG: hypothetical protein P1V35_07725 [Planctomycetota bacterium]|nr:hypothetical protein [Planctomycetota bacterium]